MKDIKNKKGLILEMASQLRIRDDIGAYTGPISDEMRSRSKELADHIEKIVREDPSESRLDDCIQFLYCTSPIGYQVYEGWQD